MADRVDPSMQGMQTTRPQPHPYRLSPQPKRQQLPPRHDPMLLLSQLRDALVEGTSLLPYVHRTYKCRLVLDSPPREALRTWGAFCGGFGGGRFGLAGGGAF